MDQIETAASPTSMHDFVRQPHTRKYFQNLFGFSVY